MTSDRYFEALSSCATDLLESYMFSNLTIRRRITVCVMSCLALLIALGSISLYTMSQTENALKTIVKDPLPGLYDSSRPADCVGHLHALTLLHTIAATPEQKAPFRREITQRESLFRAVAGKYEQMAQVRVNGELGTGNRGS